MNNIYEMGKTKYILINDDNLPTWEDILEQQKKWNEEHKEEREYAMAVSIRKEYDRWQRARAKYPDNTLDHIREF